ncbi:helix-turn-helix transcriptional regulator [Polyangium sp. y55x31]|uniref:helix-turn-helix domain-containing protein n=1 Tax=Polyangium sp. y55x31 TaxID=3042688 RepID=UPI002482880C|nr:helix-turn-helix transcriptional regulator [Polyangium sp. y55x31]MDI1476442.1 helix-turn-helix transcriptional regulator [Polyangium sp. y55x31]
MPIIGRPAIAGQEGTDPSDSSVEDTHDQDPDSVPAVLSNEMQERVRSALVAYAQGKTQHALAEALGYPRGYVAAVLDGKLHVTVHFAGQVARVLGTDINALVGGPAQPGVGAATEGAPEGAEGPPKT